MTINKKMIINLIIGVLALAVLVGVYFWATGWEPNKAGEKPIKNDQILLFDVDSDEIAEVLINNETAKFAIKKTADKESSWSVENYQGIEFSQTKIQNFIENLTRISATRKIESDGKNPTDFGLDINKNTVVIRTVDGKENTFILGEKPTQDADYYLMKKGDDNIYTISSYKADAFLKTPNDLRENVLATIDIESIETLNVEENGKKIMDIAYNKNSVDDGTFKSSPFLMTYPYNEIVNQQKFGELMAVFGTIEVNEFISDDVSDAAKYGLDNGFRIEFSESGKKHSVLLGKTDENGNVYAMYGDKPYIFTISSDIKNAFSNINPFDYIIKFAHIYALDNVSSIEVDYKGKTYNLSIQRDGDDETKNKYRINNRSLNEENFKKLYQAVIGLTITSIPQNQTAGKEVCTISFALIDGSTQTARYYECDERNLILKRHDGKKYIMLKKYLDEMIEALEKEVK